MGVDQDGEPDGSSADLIPEDKVLHIRLEPGMCGTRWCGEGGNDSPSPVRAPAGSVKV